MKKLLFIPILLCLSFICKAQYTGMYVVNNTNVPFGFRMTVENGGCGGVATESSAQTVGAKSKNYYNTTTPIYPTNLPATITPADEFTIVKFAVCMISGTLSVDNCNLYSPPGYTLNTFTECSTGITYTITWGAFNATTAIVTIQ